MSYLPRSTLKRSPFIRKRKKQSRKPKIDYTQFSYGKPVKRDIGGIREYPDGRMVFNRRHPQGAHLYRCAVVLMAERQKWLCSICGQPMLYEEASFEHGGLRGMGGGRRDDRPDLLNAEGYYQNSAAHGLCNGMRGSRRDYPMAIRLPRKEA